MEMLMTALLCAVLAGALILVCLARLWAQQRRHKRKEREYGTFDIRFLL